MSTIDIARLEGRIAQIEAELQGGALTLAELKAELAALTSPVLVLPETPQDELLVEIYELAKDLWCAQCYGFTGAPEHVKRGAHEAAREGFDAICKKLGPVVHPILRAEWKAAEAQAANAPAEPSQEDAAPPLEMADVRVGMRLRDPRCELFPLITVTEITDKGFKYVLDEPYSYGSRIGVTGSGEHYGMDGICLYELVQPPVLAVPDGSRLRELIEDWREIADRGFESAGLSPDEIDTFRRCADELSALLPTSAELLNENAKCPR